MSLPPLPPASTCQHVQLIIQETCGPPSVFCDTGVLCSRVNDSSCFVCGLCCQQQLSICNVRMLNDVDVEFSRQLSRVESLVERVPQCVINDLLQSSLTESRSELLRLHAEFLGFHREYMQQKVSLFVLVVVFLFCHRSSFLACNSRLRSAIRRHHLPQRAVLSQICCFGERKVVLFQILLDGAEPRDAGTT